MKVVNLAEAMSHVVIPPDEKKYNKISECTQDLVENGYRIYFDKMLTTGRLRITLSKDNHFIRSEIIFTELKDINMELEDVIVSIIEKMKEEFE